MSSSFDGATSELTSLLTFGGGNGNANDTFATVYAQALLNDNVLTPASAIGITAEIHQVSDTNAQISIIKEADKNQLVIDRVTYGDGVNAENFGFETCQINLNVINDEIRLQLLSMYLHLRNKCYSSN